MVEPLPPYYEIQECRICSDKHLENVIDLGTQYLSDFVVNPDEEGLSAPLLVVECQNCGLVQLKHTLKRELIYRHYWYESGISGTMRKALKDITVAVTSLANVEVGDWVLDIGSNDGTLLNSYDLDVHKVGVEPAMNLVAKCKGIDNIICDFFKPNMPFTDGTFKVITAIAMFYDLDKPKEFVQEVRRLLSPDGVFVIQMNDLFDMLKNYTFDNIGHEHLEYYSTITLEYLLRLCGLEIFNAEHNGVNGGSMRFYIQHVGGPYPINPIVAEYMRQERGITTLELKRYGVEIAQMAVKIADFINRERFNRKNIWGYGASNRGNVILQYLDLTPWLLRAIAERNPSKYGLYTVGSKIPITSEENMRWANPDYLFVNIYHFLPEIIEREREYLAKGGKLIVPISVPRIIYGEKGEKIEYI